MNRYGKRCVLYPRVSTEMQVDGYSLEGQKNMLTRFADREEMIVVDTYEDAGKSGKSIEGRPAFQKMLRDIEDGLDIDYILVYTPTTRPVEEIVESKLMWESIRKYLHKLTPKECEVMISLYVEQLSVSDTAAKLGVEKNTVSTHRRNACEKIRKEMEEN